MEKKNHVLLFSPGIDSFISNWLLKSKLNNETDLLTRVYFHVGGKYSTKECKLLLNNYDVESYYVRIDRSLSLGDIEHSDAHIPQRNLLLLTMAQARYNADFLYLNGVKDDRVSDNNKEFRELVSNILTKTAEKPVQVISLLEDKEKTEWCELYYKENEENSWENLVSKTFSCFAKYDDEEEYYDYIPVYRYSTERNSFDIVKICRFTGCLKCPACFRKICALTSCNIYIPFMDRTIIDSYTLKSHEMMNTLPRRAKSIQDYHKFICMINPNNLNGTVI